MTQQIALTDGWLPATEADRYRKDGYLFPIPAVAPEQAKAWRTALEKIERDWLDNGLPLPLNTYKRINAQCVMPLAWEIGAHPSIVNVVEGVLGPDILLYSVEFFIKEPHTTHVVTMHQDLTYWGMGEIDGLVTAWVALSPATRASGCMEFVQGSHKNPILPHKDSDDENNLLSRGQEIAVEVAQEDKVAAEIMPGEVSLHHGLMIHGSGPNTSDDRRIAAVIRYVRPDVEPEGGGKDYAVPLRGKDKAGNFIHYAPPTGLFTPEGLAQHDKIRSEQAKVMMRGTKSKGLYREAG